MKKLTTLPMMALLFIATLAFATSCSKSGAAADTPAGEFVQAIEKFTAQISDCDDMQAIQTLNQQADSDLSKFAGSDYALTTSDKDAIKKSMRGMLEAMMNKMADLTGQKIPEGTVEMAMTTLSPMIDNATTLGEVYNLATNK